MAYQAIVNQLENMKRDTSKTSSIDDFAFQTFKRENESLKREVETLRRSSASTANSNQMGQLSQEYEGKLRMANNRNQELELQLKTSNSRIADLESQLRTSKVQLTELESQLR